MFFRHIMCFILLLNNTYGFKIRKSIRNMINLNMMDENFETYNDLYLLHKYKNFFPKENYNNLIQDILNNKISKIYIDKNYNELVSVDNLPILDNLNQHYHYSNINPVLIQNIVEKSGEHNVAINFVNFTPEYLNKILLKNQENIMLL